jgi:MurNAc alpha-1-phosphate uridylyltransferase
MRPLTLDRPKALVKVAERPLIDHMLDRLVAAGVIRAVVNVHAFADDLEAHLATRRDLEIVISDERRGLLETGGGLKAARPFLGDDPILVANIDSIWTETAEAPALDRLVAAWDETRMDDLLLLAPLSRSLGWQGPGDFHLEPDGHLVHRSARPNAPFANAGVHILSPGLIDAWPNEAHGIFPHWMKLADQGRLHGVPMPGTWMHVGDPEARDAAEAQLAGGA